MGNPQVSKKYNAPGYGGGPCLSPRTAPALCDGVVVPSPEQSLQGDATAVGGALAFHAVAQKRALRKIV